MSILARPYLRTGIPKVDLSGCVLYVPLWRPDLAGSPFQSKDSIGHTCTVTGATWTPLGRQFVGTNPDYISVAHHASLSFTSGDFTIVMCVKPTNFTGNPALFCKGVHLTDGYLWYVDTNGRVHFLTEQVGAAQDTYSTQLTAAIWSHTAISRSGTSAIPYINGASAVNVAGTHTNPVTSTRNPKIGTLDDGATQPFTGIIGEVRVYARALNAVEAMQDYQVSKWRYK